MWLIFATRHLYFKPGAPFSAVIEQQRLQTIAQSPILQCWFGILVHPFASHLSVQASLTICLWMEFKSKTLHVLMMSLGLVLSCGNFPLCKAILCSFLRSHITCLMLTFISSAHSLTSRYTVGTLLSQLRLSQWTYLMVSLSTSFWSYCQSFHCFPPTAQRWGTRQVWSASSIWSHGQHTWPCQSWEASPVQDCFRHLQPQSLWSSEGASSMALEALYQHAASLGVDVWQAL